MESSPGWRSELQCRNDALFFFQAEDGIRDLYVTGVQTCALPIFPLIIHAMGALWHTAGMRKGMAFPVRFVSAGQTVRSEERRVGKECRSRWWADHEKKKDDVRMTCSTMAHVQGRQLCIMSGYEGS